MTNEHKYPEEVRMDQILKTLAKEEAKRIGFDEELHRKLMIWKESIELANPNCINCATHTKNGGNGLCSCTLGTLSIT